MATAQLAPNLAEHAYQKMRDRILTRQLPAGDPLVEERLARSLDLSRTPLREALIRLLGEGLLVKFEGGSYAVRRITATEYFQSMKVRMLLEPEAANRAAGKIDRDDAKELKDLIVSLSGHADQAEDHWQADDRLHGFIAEASGNIVLARTIQQARTPARLFELTSPFSRVAVDAGEHLTILDAAVAGDGKTARKAMLNHLRNLEKEMLAMISA